MDLASEQCDIAMRLSQASEVLVKRVPITVSNSVSERFSIDISLGFREASHTPFNSDLIFVSDYMGA
jgi:hypothetical protein